MGSIEVEFGEILRKKRLKLDYSLRAFCLEFGFDPGNMSKIERGLLPPPSEAKLNEIAEALQIEKASDEWYDFFDKAAIARGILPEHILSDSELMGKLPLVFRSLRENKLSPDELEVLIETIRRA